MPITPYLNGQQFDPETKRILGLAFEMTCAALHIGEGGGRNPEVLCEQALKDIRRPEV